jgi:fatty-acyl-CoA synthase
VSRKAPTPKSASSQVADSDAALQTVGSNLLRVARHTPHSTAIVFPDRRWSYAELLEQALMRAAALQTLGVKPGEVVGLAMADEPEAVALIVGAMLYGAVPALLALEVGAASVLAQRLAHLNAKAFVFSGEAGRAFVKIVSDAYAEVGRSPVPTLHIADAEYTALIPEGSSIPADLNESPLRVGIDDEAVIVFTSGMTGIPKTCRITHRNIMCKAAPLAERFELTGSSRMWIGVRMYQIGFVAPLIISIAIGAAVVVGCGLDADANRAMIAAERVTHAYPIYLGTWLPIINSPKFWPSDFSQLSHVCLVGPVSALRRVQRALPQAVVMNTYGSAEEGGAFCMPRAFDSIERRLVSSGKPFAGHEVRIVEPDHHGLVRNEEIGEIQVRGEGVPRPQLDNEFGSSYTADGWLRTSDLGSLAPDGSLTYHGRSSEMLRIGEETVSAVAIETVLALHPDVAVAQVVARPDAKLGQVAAAFVEVRPGGEPTAEQLITFCREHLPETHVPRYVVFISEWPTSAAKIFKPALASMQPGQRLIS